MHRSRLLVVVLSTLALVTAGATAASAAPAAPDRAPEVSFVAPIVWGSGSGSVTALGSYRCWGGEDIHLWVSVKQGGPDPTAEGSSSTVDAWYDTTVSGDVDVTCNGRWQVATVDLGQRATDWGGRELSALRDGRAWLQFCLVDEDTELLASKNRWVYVAGSR